MKKHWVIVINVLIMAALGMIAHRHQAGRDYSIVILDWKMPDLDGVETIRRIRTEVGTSTPILLISAYDWSDIEDQAKEAGANGFVSKPLFRSKLYDKINALLGTEAKSVEPENDYSDLQGLNILIAEDNDINWEIIEGETVMRIDIYDRFIGKVGNEDGETLKATKTRRASIPLTLSA